MKTQHFTLRVDLESDKGIKATPKLLDLLKKYRLKASFYLVMGGESNILDYLRSRGKLKSAGTRKLKVWGFLEKVRMLLLPKDFVGENFSILKRILDEGHELGIHGWKHRPWTRNLENINPERHIQRAIRRYEKIFDKKPTSFAAPGFSTNNQILKILEKKGISHISDFEEEKTFGRIKNIPITITGENRMPFIEYYVGNHLTDDQIISLFEKELQNKKIVSFYVHGLFECRFKINLLEKLFKKVKKKKLDNRRIVDY